MRMMIATLVIALLASPAVGDTYVVNRVRAQSGNPQDVKIKKTALSGQEVRIWWASMLNADCSPAGTMTTQIVQPPRHGELRVSDDPFYPNYPALNPRAVCDAKPAAGKQAFYRSSDDFHGHDKIMLRNITSEGQMRRITVDIDVR